MIFFFNDTATTEIYTLSLHDALPISPRPPDAQHIGGLRAPPLAPEHERRRRDLRVAVGAVVLEVDRRRRAVVLEPGAHRPGLAEAPQVLLHRLLLDRGRIVRPRLVHVAEIDLLASGGEGLGKVGHLVE